MDRPLLQTGRPRRIALFRALQLGDMLCAVPALRALRGACPEARITLVGLPWAQAFAERYPAYLDDFVAFPGFPGLPERSPDLTALPAFLAAMRARRFDLAVQMHGDGQVSNGVVARFHAACQAGFGTPRTGAIRLLPFPHQGHEIRRLLALTDFLGAPHRGEHLEFPVTAADEAELAASGLAAGLIPGGYICLHPGARQRDKCWPPACFAAVGEGLHAATGMPLVLTGSEAETDLTRAVQGALGCPSIDAAAPIGAGALAALLGGCRLVVSNDTGVSHLAAALRRPSVTVFRASDPERWAPLDQRLHPAVWAPPEAPPLDGLRRVLAHALALLDATRRTPWSAGATGPGPAP